MAQFLPPRSQHRAGACCPFPYSSTSLLLWRLLFWESAEFSTAARCSQMDGPPCPQLAPQSWPWGWSGLPRVQQPCQHRIAAPQHIHPQAAPRLSKQVLAEEVWAGKAELSKGCSPTKALLVEKQTIVRPLQTPQNCSPQPEAWGYQLPRLCLKAKGAGWPLTNGHVGPVVKAGGRAVQEAYTSNSALQSASGPGSQDSGDSRAQLWQRRGPSPGGKENPVWNGPRSS